MNFFCKYLLLLGALMLLSFFSGGCSTLPALPRASSVALEQFMGTWYIHGYTPIVIDKDAYSATESYAVVEDRIEATYRFRKGGFDGPEKVYTPTATVYDKESNAEWRMQFIWPLKSKYIIMYLDESSTQTIIAHPNRKYTWIMSRSPAMKKAVYQEHLSRLKLEGFDLERIQRVPHKDPSSG